MFSIHYILSSVANICENYNLYLMVHIRNGPSQLLLRYLISYTWLACMISCSFFTPLQKIFDYLPVVLYEMVDSSKLFYDLKLFIFHLLWCWSALQYNSNAICGFKISSFFSTLKLPKVVEFFSEKFVRFLYLTVQSSTEKLQIALVSHSKICT